jgi:hypothetical protein
MPRIVFIVLALFVLWRVLASLGKRRAAGGLGADSYSRFSPRQRRRRLDLDDPAEPTPEELLRCAECGTYIPSGRVLVGEGDAVFCGSACRKLHAGGTR